MVSAPSLVSSPRTAADGRVLVLLSPQEWTLFFPGGFSLPGVEVLEAHGEGGSGIELLRRAGAEVVVTGWSTPRLPENPAAEMPSLRYVCHTCGSVKHLVSRTCLEQGVLVTNWGTLVADTVAEHALLLILSGLRRAPEWPPVIAGELPWQPSPVQTKTLFGKCVGIHGFGNVARSLVRLLAPFGVNISAFSQGVPEEVFADFGVRQCTSLEDLFSSNDVVVGCEALNPLTLGSVSRRVLEAMPEGALFVNVGRGAIVDETALARLCREGRVHAALDVYEADPIPPNSPLHEVPGIVMSPHIAGPTSDQFARCGELARKNLAAYFQGQPPAARVTLEIYDRST